MVTFASGSGWIVGGDWFSEDDEAAVARCDEAAVTCCGGVASGWGMDLGVAISIYILVSVTVA